MKALVSEPWRSSNYCQVGQGSYRLMEAQCLKFWGQPIRKDPPGVTTPLIVQDTLS